MPALRRFFRTPKGLLTLCLTLLAAVAAAGPGAGRVAPGLLSAIATAAAVDLPILRARSGRWEFPSGAVLTGFFVAMVLSPQEPWYVPPATSAIAIVSKYLFRTRSANIFNPAALALVVTFYLFDTGQSWWGALPEVSPLALPVLFGTGIFIAGRVNKFPLVLAFLGSYFLLFAVTAFAGNPEHVAEIFRSPDAHAALYFAFFILTDPPTSPVKYRGQLFCGLLVALVSYAVFEWIGAAYYLLAGVLAGNLWEAASRSGLLAGLTRTGPPVTARGRGVPAS